MAEPLTLVFIGRDDWIRTSDPLTPSQVRYQAALHPAFDRIDRPVYDARFFAALMARPFVFSFILDFGEGCFN